jgi:tripartite ATP-independent transporter DctM subunit
LAGQFWRSLDGTVDGILVAAIAIEFIAVLANVFTRTFLGFSILWVAEVSELALGVMAFVGGAIAYPRGQHIAVQALVERLPQSWRPYHTALIDWLIFASSLYVAWWSLPILQSSWVDRTTVLQIPGSLITLPVTFGAVLLMIYTARRQFNRAWLPAVAVGAAVLLIGAGLNQTEIFWRPAVVGDVLWIVLALFAILIAIGLPVGFVLLLGAFAYLYGSNSTPLIAVPAGMQHGVAPFVLLAIPFFVLAGLIMDKGGVSTRLVDFVIAVVGRFRGGLLQAMIISMYLFSGISGSKGADIAAVGSVMSGTLRRNGYDPGESVAVLTSSAAMGESIPPSIAMILVGSITTVSVGALFVAGLLPAAAIALCLGVVVYLRALRGGMNALPSAGLRQVSRTAVRAVLPLTVPVILFGGILSGIATPTEVSSFAIAFGLVLAMVVYRELSPRALIKTTIYSATMVGMILFIISTANAFTFAVTIETLPARIASAMTSAPGGPLLFLALTVVVVVVMGALLEGLAALLIFAPILMPVAMQLGLNPLHYAIVMIIAMGVGAFAPPLGVGLYIACAVCETPMEKAIRPMIPYFAVLFIGLLLVTFVPQLTLIVPILLHIPGSG